MQIAIIADIHDHINNLRKALKMTHEADALICCGDLCSPFIVKELGEGFTKGNIHIVFGNNDGDLFRITTKANEYPHMKLHGEFAELDLGDKKFGISHFDNIGRAMAESEVYDVVCFGHNHQFEISENGDTLIINPGEIMGGLTGNATFAIYDTNKHEARRSNL
ncbi:MAG: YfcE family phosphodiesterase [bacterium]